MYGCVTNPIYCLKTFCLGFSKCSSHLCRNDLNAGPANIIRYARLVMCRWKGKIGGLNNDAVKMTYVSVMLLTDTNKLARAFRQIAVVPKA